MQGYDIINFSQAITVSELVQATAAITRALHLNRKITRFVLCYLHVQIHREEPPRRDMQNECIWLY